MRMPPNESMPPKESDCHRLQHLDAWVELEVGSSYACFLLMVPQGRRSFAQAGSAVVVALRLPLCVAPASVEVMTIVDVVIEDFGQLQPLGLFWE
jgi:hypothetical protein